VGAALVVTLLFVAQFVPVDRTNPPVEADVAAPSAVKAILVKACYDCHSHETRWPWYSRVAPLSWWVAGHVHEGRRDLNFSRWPTFDFVSQELILREIDKQVSGGTMPLPSYRLGHPEARLDAAERELLLTWVREGLGETDELLQ
jgi:hypothetical protein